MIHDNEINTLETEKAELQAKYADCGTEILRAKTTLSSSVDLKAIKQATSTREAAILARGNIERRILRIGAEISEWRYKQRAFQAQLAEVPGRLANLKKHLAELRQRRSEQEDTLIRLGGRLESTVKQFNRLPKPAHSDAYVLDPVTHIRAEVKNRKEHQELNVNRLSQEIPIIDWQIAEAEASIEKTERYLEGLRQMA